MRIQNLKVHDDAEMCTLSALWLVNSRKGGANAAFSNQLVTALITAEVPLYFIDEDIDSRAVFNKYRLTSLENSEVCMHVACSEFDESDMSNIDTCVEYFAESVRDSNLLSSDKVPFWFGAHVSIGPSLDGGTVMSEPVPIASLYVKAIDVKQVCQLQGIASFLWPNEYPNIGRNLFVVYSLENGLWTRVMPTQSETRHTEAGRKEALEKIRVFCILKVLNKKNIINDSGAWKPSSGKRPSSSQIYEWVRNDPSFCKHGQAGRDPIAKSTFNQLWKEGLRAIVLQSMGVVVKKW